MEAVTIREAKARLNALVEAAERGEQVVIMRGSKLVAAIVPVSENDFELHPRLTDAQAERLWRQIRHEREDGSSLVFESARGAAAFLAKPPAPRLKSSPSRGRRARKTKGR